MKIGDEVFVHGYVDEIIQDIVIIRNEGGYFGTVEGEIMENSPPVTPTERTGEWIERIGGISKELFYQCSKCYGEVDADEFNYCPWCGADMRGDTE